MTDFMKPRCPVEVGDYFYRKNHCNDIGATIPDRVEVKSIRELEKPMIINELTGKKAYYAIHGKYIYHSIGPDLERDFSETYFENPNVVIERKRDRK